MRAAAVGALSISLLVAAAGAASAAQRPPNVIVIQTDDENFSDLRPAVMPNTWRFIVGHGTFFTHYDVATPLCCPSRASLLTGQYPHNDGVFNNKPGYPALRDPGSTLPAWLEASGYVTAHVGKYLNRYEKTAPSLATPAPGWDRWYSIAQAAHYYDYDLGANGRLVHFGTKPRDHITRVLSRYSLALIRRYADGPKPLYLQVDERAPHDSGGPSIPSKCHQRPLPELRDQHALTTAKLRRPASFNERNVSDKPPFIRHLPLLGSELRDEIRRDNVCRLESLRGVDRAVGHIWHQLAKLHALRDTVVIFTSDNGYFQGQHRIVKGKSLPYEAAIHQPLAIRVPRAYRSGPRIRRVREQTANIDLAPTILDLAGGEPCNGAGDCRTMDGRSLVGLLGGGRSGFPPDRPILVELSNGHGVHGVCAYRAVHEIGHFLVDYSSAYDHATQTCVPAHYHELYQLHRDSSELHNLYPAPAGSPAAAQQARLEDELGRLRDCAGIRGRDPLPASGHYCG